MKLLYLPLLALELAVLTTGCAPAKASTESEGAYSRTIAIEGSFSSISTSAMVDVTFTADNSAPKAVLTGTREAVDQVDVVVSDGVLVFNRRNTSHKKLKPVKVTLNGPGADSFSASSMAGITVLTPVNTPGDLNVQVASMGKVVFNKAVEAGRMLNVSVASKGKAVFMDRLSCASRSNFAVASMGKVTAGRMDLAEARISVASTGNVTGGSLTADEVSLMAASGGEIKLAGVQSSSVDMSAASTGEITVGKCVAGSMHCAAASMGEITALGCAVGKTDCMAASTGRVTLEGTGGKGTFQALSSATIDIKKFKCSGNTSVTASSAGKVLL